MNVLDIPSEKPRFSRGVDRRIEPRMTLATAC